MSQKYGNLVAKKTGLGRSTGKNIAHVIAQSASHLPIGKAIRLISKISRAVLCRFQSRKRLGVYMWQQYFCDKSPSQLLTLEGI